ncbi:MAG: hypothetical protein R3F39_06605 [Myxococcota bacterium]
MMRSMGMRDAVRKWGIGVVVAGLVASAGCASQNVRALAGRAVVDAQDARQGVARALAEVDLALAARKPETAVIWVEAAWKRRDDLADDRLVRAAIAKVPASSLPEALRAGRQVEDAVAAMQRGDAALALAIVSPAAETVEATDALSVVRARTLRGVAAAQVSPEQAPAFLARASATSAPGALAEQARDRARLLAATLAMEAGDEKAAIAEFLRVETGSGLWRAARTGLAMCQLRIGQPDRALQVIALLPGGLTGDPERAVLAAMGADGIGEVETARSIVADVLEDDDRWKDATVDEVLAWQVSHPRGPVLREPDEGMIPTLATSAALRGLGNELRASEASAAAHPEDRALAAYAAAIDAAFREDFARELETEKARVARARQDLETLLPQLAPQKGRR